MKNIIAIIPARGGSKRIKNKNIKLFNKKPMIYWSIQAAIKSNLFDRIIVSTDSRKIASYAKKFGAEVPFMRSKILADDITSPYEVVKDSILKIKGQLSKSTHICCIYACAPNMAIKDLKYGYKESLKRKSYYVLPIVEYPHPIQRSFKLNKNKKIIVEDKKAILQRTQDLCTFYHDAGQFYWGNLNTWLKKELNLSNGYGFPIPYWRSIDVDTLDDWERAEIMSKVISYRLNEK